MKRERERGGGEKGGKGKHLNSHSRHFDKSFKTFCPSLEVGRPRERRRTKVRKEEKSSYSRSIFIVFFERVILRYTYVY